MVTPIAGLPEISENQANKAITHNTALRQLEINLGAVISRTLTTPPSSPAEGALYIVPTGASGAWSGQTNKIAQWSNGGWNIYSPFQYQRLYSIADSAVIIYVGTSWSVFNSSGGGSGDMLKSIYDTDNDGIVDSAESVVDGAITTTKIANDAVTFSKIQNIATNRLLGRSSASSGDIEEITIGSGLSLSFNTLSFTGESEILTADRTYFVNPSGNDNNNGLSSETAFQTISKAINTAVSLVLNGFTVTIQLADGVYTLSTTLNLKGFSKSGKIIIQGNNSNNTAVTIQSSSSNTITKALIRQIEPGLYRLKNLKIVHEFNSGTLPTWNVSVLSSGSGCNLELDNINFGLLINTASFSKHILSEINAYVEIVSNYTISGGGSSSSIHIEARNAGLVFYSDNITTTFVNNPVFGDFISVSGTSVLGAYLPQSSGTATITQKYFVTGNAVINCFNSTPNFNSFPGGAGNIDSANGGRFL